MSKNYRKLTDQIISLVGEKKISSLLQTVQQD